MTKCSQPQQRVLAAAAAYDGPATLRALGAKRSTAYSLAKMGLLKCAFDAQHNHWLWSITAEGRALLEQLQQEEPQP